jgi:hypothetical protein
MVIVVACKSTAAAAKSDGGIQSVPVRHLKKVPASDRLISGNVATLSTLELHLV